MSSNVSGLVAIHQPNFFPWLGYFHKIAKADVFVFLDNVAYPKSGNSMGSFVNRVKILIQGEPRWFGCRVVREHGEQIISQVHIDDQYPWREKFLKTIEYNYKRTPYFEEVFGFIQGLVRRESNSLAEFNAANIIAICDNIGITTEFVRQSALNTTAASTALLVETVSKVGGEAYICGGGAGGYQQDEAFATAGLSLVYQNFLHPRYSQNGVGEFVPGLSVIDALMNCGFSATRQMLVST